MAYQTGTYTTLEQLLDTFRVFAEANGWTTDAFVDFRGGKWLAHHNADGIYLHWYSANNVPVNVYYRDTNGSYSGSNVTRIVLHPATGYDSNKHPAWQPGVAGADAAYYSYGSTRQILNTGQLATSGIYHFLSFSGSLALFVDVGGSFVRHLGVFKTQGFSGSELTYAASGSYGASSSTTDASLERFFSYDNSTGKAYFSNEDTNAVFASGAWSKSFYNVNAAFVSMRMSMFYTSESGRINYNDLLLSSGVSGVSGVRPLHPVIFQKRVSNVFRFDSMLPHVAHINGYGLANAQEIQTASGAWRVFQFGSYAEYHSIAIRSDL